VSFVKASFARPADVIRLRAAATPDATAFIEPGKRTTFAQLDRRSSQVAQALVAAGVRPGDRVAFLGANSPAFLEIVYGAAKAGAIATAINNRLSPTEVTAILADALPAVLVLDDARLEPPPGLVPTIVHLHAEYDRWLADRPARDPGHAPSPHDTAVVVYTSGTTGQPRGIMLTGDNLGRSAAHHDLELTTGSVIHSTVPWFQVSGLAPALAAHLEGAALLLETAASPDELLAMLSARLVSHATLAPATVAAMTGLPRARRSDWSALRHITYAGPGLTTATVDAATAVFGCRFVQTYGLTEAAGAVTILSPDDHRLESRLQSVGRPVPGMWVRVVDPVTLDDVPAGARGEILVGGGQVMRGYWRRPEATQRSIVDGWLRTGDVGSLDAHGYLHLHDRVKDLIVSRGEAVYPAEIERVLTGHPDLVEAAVVGVPTRRGESPYAVVVPRAGRTPNEAELLSWCRHRLARFKCPVGVSVVDTLPRNTSGKLQKHRLRTALR
jgi:acyl-CoA synthetase (AMP-forming)/AMP-acid ligase II